ncbi:MAG: hypothetical protein AB7S38_00280 [Vulcanimicrobiota bacterium]
MKKTLLVTLITLLAFAGLFVERYYQSREFVVIGEVSQPTVLWLEKSGCDLVRADNQLLVRVHDREKTLQGLRYALEYNQLNRSLHHFTMGMFIEGMGPESDPHYKAVEIGPDGRAVVVERTREVRWVYDPTSAMAHKSGNYAGYRRDLAPIPEGIGPDEAEARMIIGWMRQLSDQELLFSEFVL